MYRTSKVHVTLLYNRSRQVAIVPKFLSPSANSKVRSACGAPPTVSLKDYGYSCRKKTVAIAGCVRAQYCRFIMSSSQVDRVVEAYKAAAKYAAPTSALVLPPEDGDGIVVVSSWSQRSLEAEKTAKFQQTHVLDASLRTAVRVPPVDVASELMSAVSPTSQLRAVLRDVPGGPGATKRQQFLEVWRRGLLWLSLDLDALDVHGDVCTDGEFGCLEWSPCEQKLVYVAEEKLAKSESFVKVKSQEKKEQADSKTSRGQEHVYRQDWGEQLVGKHRPVLVVCDTSRPSAPLTVLQGLPPHLCAGQACWAPGGRAVVGVAWDSRPRRLGLIYCSNRSSVLFHLALDSGVFTALSGDGLAVTSPRFSPDGRTLVWLQRRAGGPHHSALSLWSCPWQDSPAQVEGRAVVPVVLRHSSTADGKQFHGLYNHQLPRRCWCEDSRRLVLSTPQRYCVCLYVVDTVSGSLMQLAPRGEQYEDVTVLDVSGDVVVCALSSFTSLPCLVAGRVPPAGQEHVAGVCWSALTHPETPPQLEGMQCCHLDLQQETDNPCKSFNAIYFGPGSSEERVPLVVWPHGGPHSVFSSNYKMEAAFLASLGFGLLLVNYRGSVGMGQECVESLLGKIGSSDVSDVHLAATQALHRLPQLDPARVVLMGGSHGGFLVTHLSAQHPMFYKAVVARNPVVDVATMFSISDIPDWCAVEVGAQYDPAADVSPEVYRRMKEASPVVRVQSVVAPTLLCLGSNDMRVPCSQGLSYYHLLRANNVVTRVLLYDDCHPLGKAPVELDNIINAALWFKEHLGILS